MRLEDYFEFLGPDDIRLKGTRVGIETVLYEFLHGSRSPEEIAGRYPSLSREQVYATVTWYLHAQEEADAFLARWLERVRQARDEQERHPPPAIARLRQVRRDPEQAHAP